MAFPLKVLSWSRKPTFQDDGNSRKFIIIHVISVRLRVLSSDLMRANRLGSRQYNLPGLDYVVSVAPLEGKADLCSSRMSVAPAKSARSSCRFETLIYTRVLLCV